MQISGTSANNINFVEQKTNNVKTEKTQSEKSSISHSDTFANSDKSAFDISVHYDTLGMLETAQNSISKLKESNQDLQELAEQFSLFNNEEKSLHVKFDEKVENMLEVVDAAVYNNVQLFYTQMPLNQERTASNSMMSEIISIEDLSIENKDELDIFEGKLNALEEDIKSSINYTQNLAFNSLAALSDTQDLNSNELEEVSVQNIQRAHDVNSLVDKISTLLAD